MSEDEGRQQNLAARKPMSAIHNHPAYQPAGIVKEQVAYGAEPAVARGDGIADDSGGILQHRMILFYGFSKTDKGCCRVKRLAIA